MKMYEQRYRWEDSPFLAGIADGVSYSPEIRSMCDLSSAHGHQWIHDVLLDLIETLSRWNGVGYYYYATNRGDDEPEEHEGNSAVQALETVECIEEITKGLRDELLSMPPDDLMREVCERLQSVISTLGWDLRELRMRALPPAVGNLVADDETVLHDVKRAMRTAYEECKQGLREVAFKVEVRAAAAQRESSHLSFAPSVTSPKPICVVPLDADVKSNQTALATNVLTPAEDLAGRFEIAYRSYKFAERELFNRGAETVDDRTAWDYLNEHGVDGYTPRSFDTWQRYVRDGRRFHKDRKNIPRGGREGRSIVEADDE